MPIGETETVKIDNCENLKCSNCDKSLFILPKQEKTSEEVLFELTVDCPFCGDKSFEKPLYGPIRYVPADKVLIIDFVLDGKKAHFKTKRAYT